MTFFILGSHPELSRAEIGAVTGRDDLFLPSPNVLLAPKMDENLTQLGARLGGIIKTGHIIGELPSWDKASAADLIAAYAAQAPGEEKIYFGISLYQAGDDSRAGVVEKDLERVGLEVKKRLKTYGRPVRLVTSKKSDLSAVVVTKNHLLESGGEYVLLPMEDKILVGQTAAVQDFEAWSHRDYGRPARDAKSGMLPPKLARMMINLSGADPQESTILDAFCGSGTVLMEAALMGFQKIVGSDISEKAMDDTEKNLKWLIREFDLKDPDISLYTAAAEKLPAQFADPVDVIVSETYLGPPRTGHETPAQLEIILKDLLKMYIPTFTTLRSLLKPSGTAVVALPAYVQGKRTMFMPIESHLKTTGFELTDRFLYVRKGQHVARDILLLRPIRKGDAVNG